MTQPVHRLIQSSLAGSVGAGRETVVHHSNKDILKLAEAESGRPLCCWPQERLGEYSAVPASTHVASRLRVGVVVVDVLLERSD